MSARTNISSRYLAEWDTQVANVYQQKRAKNFEYSINVILWEKELEWVFYEGYVFNIPEITNFPATNYTISLIKFFFPAPYLKNFRSRVGKVCSFVIF